MRPSVPCSSRAFESLLQAPGSTGPAPRPDPSASCRPPARTRPSLDTHTHTHTHTHTKRRKPPHARAAIATAYIITVRICDRRARRSRPATTAGAAPARFPRHRGAQCGYRLRAVPSDGCRWPRAQPMRLRPITVVAEAVSLAKSHGPFRKIRSRSALPRS